MKCVVLLSSGFDSPVAAGMMGKDCEVILLHFYNSKSSVERAKKLRDKLGKNFVLYTVPNRIIQEKLFTAEGYGCIICKRAMYRLANAVCKILGADFLVTGENVGQVASQTPNNLRILDEASELPVIRPLIAYDKKEIIDLAREIGTFQVSSLPELKCDFVPAKPVTKADLKRVLSLEDELGIDKLVYDCLDGLKLVK